MIPFVPSAAAKNRVSRSARGFAASRKTADPRTEKRSLLVNLDKQPTVIHRPDGSQIVFTYDSAGRLSTTTYPKGPNTSDGTVTVTRAYSATTGKLASVSASDGQTITYGYDGRLLTSTTWSGTVAGSVSRTYNNDFRVASESVNGANSVALGYDNDGLLASADGLTIVRDPTNSLITDTTLGQVTDHRTYDGFGMVATYEAKFGTTSLYSTVYVRDSVGRIEQKTETIQGTTTVWNYSYDSAGRLWQVMHNGVLAATYLYDANGNRQSKTTPSGTETGTYDDQDRLLTYGKWAYTYTANGELRTKTDTTNGQLTTYSYDGAGNLRKVDLPDGRSIEYVIDPRGRRVAKKVAGAVSRRWSYDSRVDVAAEFDGNGAMLARYTAGMVAKSAKTYRLIGDAVGSPVLAVDSGTGQVLERLTFDEWGQVTGDSSPGFHLLGFAGGVYDSDTGLVRFGARDYDPETGRWTSKDPIGFRGGQFGLYSYSRNNPQNVVDPAGLDVYFCQATVQGNFWLNLVGAQHYWIKTDTKEAGIGADAEGGGGYGDPISVFDASGDAQWWWENKHDNVCRLVPNVDENFINSFLPGPDDDPIPYGNWSFSNSCQTFVTDLLSAAHTGPNPQEPDVPPMPPGARPGRW
jgi:RHS repeat-associated protein